MRKLALVSLSTLALFEELTHHRLRIDTCIKQETNKKIRQELFTILIKLTLTLTHQGFNPYADSVAQDQPFRVCVLVRELYYPLICKKGIHSPTSRHRSSQVKRRRDVQADLKL